MSSAFTSGPWDVLEYDTSFQVVAILGDEAGHAIIADMGVRWAVVAAMAAATTADDPKALAAIRKHNAEQFPARENASLGGAETRTEFPNGKTEKSA